MPLIERSSSLSSFIVLLSVFSLLQLYLPYHSVSALIVLAFALKKPHGFISYAVRKPARLVLQDECGRDSIPKGAGNTIRRRTAQQRQWKPYCSSALPLAWILHPLSSLKNQGTLSNLLRHGVRCSIICI